MSEGVSGFVVTFKNEVSGEYFDKIKSAIECFNAVIDVSPIMSDYNSYIIEERVKMEYKKKLFEVLR